MISVIKPKKILLFLILLFFFLMLSGWNNQSQEDCGECPNPLVELEPMKIGGDIPDHFKNYEVEWSTKYWSGWAWLFFKRQNPCVDSYYIMETPLGESRHGAKKGKAKYIIKSYSIIEAGNGDVPVIHLSGWDGNDFPKKEGALIPRLGTIEIHHDLIAVKNGELYDFCVSQIDWVEEPPDDEYYGFPWGEKVIVGGLPYTGNDGLFCGEWGPHDLAIGDISFEKGDVGVTIRKKETPSSCSLETDNVSLYPPYYKLDIKNIRNLFNEPMPNNVRIALKTDEGTIEGGEEELEGWKVFTTREAKIPSQVLYKPPDCSKSKKDTLRIAAVCDWHDGEPSVGKSRITKEISIPQCFVRSGSMTKRHYTTHTEENAWAGGESRDHSEWHIEISAFMTFEEKPFFVEGEEDRILYYFRLQSYSISSFNIYSKGDGYNIEKAPGFGTVAWIRWTDWSRGSAVKISPVGDPPEAELVLHVDRKTQKVVEAELPAFDIWTVWKGEHMCKRWNLDEGDNDCSYSLDKEEYQSVDQGGYDTRIVDDGVHTITGFSQSVDKYEYGKIEDTHKWTLYRY